MTEVEERAHKVKLGKMWTWECRQIVQMQKKKNGLLAARNTTCDHTGSINSISLNLTEESLNNWSDYSSTFTVCNVFSLNLIW